MNMEHFDSIVDRDAQIAFLEGAGWKELECDTWIHPRDDTKYGIEAAVSIATQQKEARIEDIARKETRENGELFSAFKSDKYKLSVESTPHAALENGPMSSFEILERSEKPLPPLPQPTCGFCKGSGEDVVPGTRTSIGKCLFCNGLGYGTGNAGEPLKPLGPTQTPGEQMREAMAEKKGRATYILTLFPEPPQVGGWSFLLGHGPHHFSSLNFPTAERAAKAAADFLQEFIQDPEVFIYNHKPK